jgi:hypothetical protein
MEYQATPDQAHFSGYRSEDNAEGNPDRPMHQAVPPQAAPPPSNTLRFDPKTGQRLF